MHLGVLIADVFEQNTLATTANHIRDLQIDSNGPGFALLYVIQSEDTSDPFYVSVYSQAPEHCDYSITTRLQCEYLVGLPSRGLSLTALLTAASQPLTFGKAANGSIGEGYWSYYDFNFVSKPQSFSLEVTADCEVPPSPYLRYVSLGVSLPLEAPAKRAPAFVYSIERRTSLRL